MSAPTAFQMLGRTSAIFPSLIYEQAGVRSKHISICLCRVSGAYQLRFKIF